jgi:nucleoside-diphosphate-sugar epimerase
MSTSGLNPGPQTTAGLDELISRPTAAVIQAIERIPGRFAVLGAGGKMGFHISLMLQRCLKALNRAEPVITVSRFGSPAVREQFEAAGFDVVAADLSDPSAVAELPDVQNVVFLAGVKFGTSHDSQLLQRMNVDLPQLVANQFQSSRIVALSTGCVYSFMTPQSGGSTEDCQTDPPGDYAKSCLGRESAFVNAAKSYGTRSSIIRLNYSIDLRYGVLLDIATNVMHGNPVSLQTGYVNVIWQGDAVAHVLQSFMHAAAPPCILNVTGPAVLHVRDIAEQFGREFRRPVTFDGEEAPTAWLSNAAQSHQMFGVPSCSLATMMSWTAEWLKHGGDTLDKPTHFEVRSGSY